ncbi:hypothetical protein SBOR_10010 [Sclerotinia borealis F-4128]|uniref:Uncharacterized protein n=1 Tax=Sclerotinia borealis (strain F-4128) TaxID=1432307 RepID=W9C4V2_SCLBF|nr:hypothetical protein SBOR_10010 [Sclerotinia borealis F-4128]
MSLSSCDQNLSIDSSRTQSPTTDSTQLEGLSGSDCLSKFPNFHLLPTELQWEILYQAAALSEPRVISVHFKILDAYGPSLLYPIPEGIASTEAFLQAGGKWKTKDGDFVLLALYPPSQYDEHNMQPGPPAKFHFRPEKDILRMDSLSLLQISKPESIKHLAIPALRNSLVGWKAWWFSQTLVSPPTTKSKAYLS